MARAMRVECVKAAYHVAGWGNERTAICRDAQAPRIFLDTPATACDRFSLVVRAYGLRPKHCHLLTQKPRARLGAAVGWLWTTCSNRSNRRSLSHVKS